MVSSLGKDVARLKLLAIAVSASLASIAGALYATYINFIDPNTFGMMESFLMLSAVCIGGVNSMRGAVLGAVMLIAIPEVLRFGMLPSQLIGPVSQMTFGGALVLAMILRPRGLFG